MKLDDIQTMHWDVSDCLAGSSATCVQKLAWLADQPVGFDRHKIFQIICAAALFEVDFLQKTSKLGELLFYDENIQVLWNGIKKRKALLLLFIAHADVYKLMP